MRPKRILLIGGAGFIGSNIIKHFSDRKGQFVAYVLEPELAYIGRLEGLNVNVLRGDLSNTELLERIILENQIDSIIHLVSSLVPGSSFDEYKCEINQVVFPSILLMEFCAKHNIQFVYFSSGGTIYGENDDISTKFSEKHPMAPISHYGWSKQMMENSIHYMHRTQGLNYLIIRPSNPYGKGQNINGRQGLIAVAIGKMLSGQILQIWGDGASVRDYIHIDDLGSAVVDILSDDTIINKTINIGSGEGYSVNDIIGFIRSVAREELRVDYVQARKMDVSSVVLDINQLRKLIDFQPIGIQDGIRRFYEEVKNGE